MPGRQFGTGSKSVPSTPSRIRTYSRWPNSPTTNALFPGVPNLKRRYLSWTADSAQVDGINRVFRTGMPWSDIPESQVALGDMLLAFPGLDAENRAGAHEGKAMGLMALGRPRQALAEVDSAAAFGGWSAAALEQAEWRVVLRAFGLPIEESPDWRARLTALAGDPLLGARASWALGFAAYAAGDTSEGHRWLALLNDAGTDAAPLRQFLSAMGLAAQGEWQAALALSDSLELEFNASTPPDPFARAAFHLQRGSWRAALGNHPAADREWLWYEASDIEGWPHGPAQAGELDGMLGVYARLLRAEALLQPGSQHVEREIGCAHAKRVSQIWSRAEATFLPLKARADSLLERCSQ